LRQLARNHQLIDPSSGGARSSHPFRRRHARGSRSGDIGRECGIFLRCVDMLLVDQCCVVAGFGVDRVRRVNVDYLDLINRVDVSSTGVPGLLHSFN
jgi:hypothetical protein